MDLNCGVSDYGRLTLACILSHVIIWYFPKNSQDIFLHIFSPFNIGVIKFKCSVFPNKTRGWEPCNSAHIRAYIYTIYAQFIHNAHNINIDNDQIHVSGLKYVVLCTCICYADIKKNIFIWQLRIFFLYSNYGETACRYIMFIRNLYRCKHCIGHHEQLNTSFFVDM